MVPLVSQGRLDRGLSTVLSSSLNQEGEWKAVLCVRALPANSFVLLVANEPSVPFLLSRSNTKFLLGKKQLPYEDKSERAPFTTDSDFWFR